MTQEKKQQKLFILLNLLSSKMGTIICLQFSRTPEGILFQHLRYLEKYLLKAESKNCWLHCQAWTFWEITITWKQRRKTTCSGTLSYAASAWGCTKTPTLLHIYCLLFKSTVVFHSCWHAQAQEHTGKAFFQTSYGHRVSTIAIAPFLWAALPAIHRTKLPLNRRGDCTQLCVGIIAESIKTITSHATLLTTPTGVHAGKQISVHQRRKQKASLLKQKFNSQHHMVKPITISNGTCVQGVQTNSLLWKL